MSYLIAIVIYIFKSKTYVIVYSNKLYTKRLYNFKVIKLFIKSVVKLADNCLKKTLLLWFNNYISLINKNNKK